MIWIASFWLIHFLPDYCDNHTCGMDQQCETLADAFTCTCTDVDSVLVNGSCVRPAKTNEVGYEIKMGNIRSLPYTQIYIYIWKLI